MKDGRGGVVARWTLGDSTQLRVAARFGGVLILQDETLQVTTIEDTSPKVLVQDTPRTLRATDAREVPMVYEVTDDHGLTQVDLVLRAGEREDRRVVARLDGQTRLDRGAVVVQSDDRFVRGVHVPIEIVMEARDNDPIRGPKWGRSETVVLIPPAVGEAEAKRCEALRELRGAAVDMLARRLTTEVPTGAKAVAPFWRQEREAHHKLNGLVQATIGASYGGLGVPRRLAALVRGQMDRLHRAVDSTCEPGNSHGACAGGYAKVRDTSEVTVLALDGAMRALADADAASISRRLAEVAEDAALGAKLWRESEPKRGSAKLQAALTVLGGGARSLGRLESLGHDLAEVVEIGVRRIERTVRGDDLRGAELAAVDLARRLRRPYPSFAGGGGQHGTEAGGGAPLDGLAAGGEMQDSFEQKGNALDELAREHAAEMENLQRALADAMREVQTESSREQAREHARRIRRAVSGLPTRAMETSSVGGAAAMMRENAERMAEALDRLGFSEAQRAGENALRAADEARRMAFGQSDLFGQPPAEAHAVERARTTVEQELGWVRERMEQAQRAAADRSGESVRRSAGAEQELAERTKRLAEQGSTGETPLPQDTVEMLREAEQAMRQAAQALRGADTERGVDRQREGQRLLDIARESQRDDASQADVSRGNQDGSSDSERRREARDESGMGRPLATGRVDIPGADAFRGPEEFRKRVVRGLSEPVDPRLRDAVRRYAEGLLR
ncbi:MAG: DUF4175 domain-containing protein [Polyangiaceae bacterium]|nr:DUF4175 domain-containing protein [Polyangiaceae bacterium]